MQGVALRGHAQLHGLAMPQGFRVRFFKNPSKAVGLALHVLGFRIGQGKRDHAQRYRQNQQYHHDFDEGESLHASTWKRG